MWAIYRLGATHTMTIMNDYDHIDNQWPKFDVVLLL